MKYTKAILTALFLLASVPASAAKAPVPQAIHLEAEDAQLSGPAVASQRAGYTGTGYVTGFLHSTDKITLMIPHAVAGLYDARIRYSAQSPKGYDLVINGKHNSGMFKPSGEAFASQDAGNVQLASGQNTVEILYGWGYYDVDSIDFIPAVVKPLAKPPIAPVDPDATPQARALKAYLVREYGPATLTGQALQSDQPTQPDISYIQATTGKLPAIVGNDFIDYSPSRVAFGSAPAHESEDMIATAKAGRIVTMMWHWNAPTDLINRMDNDTQGNKVDHMWYRGFYTEATTFDLEKAIDDPNSSDYQLMLRDMDAIAAQLKKFQDAGVPLLWRPLHEAEGGWFWWGAKGPEPYKKLWRLMYNRFTQHDHLHNLIWVYSSGTNPDWYPGDQYVDVVGIDEYPSDLHDTESSDWKLLQSEYGGRKLVALTEFGGAPDIPKMRALGARWSYFLSWTDTVGPKKNVPADLKKIYTWPTVVTADKLPHPAP